ncbi:hypothetical protein ECFRIK523_5765, partial [Escherichia coli FRIK523]
MYCPLNSA